MEEDIFNGILGKVKEFLMKNGFVCYKAYFLSDSCSITMERDHYVVKTDEGEWFSNDLLIYSLIGYLTYNGLMDKNYNQ
jgi:hypothetical protein